MNNDTHNHKHDERHTFLFTEIETKFCAQVNDISILAPVIIGGHLYYVVEEPERINVLLCCFVLNPFIWHKLKYTRNEDCAQRCKLAFKRKNLVHRTGLTTSSFCTASILQYLN